MVKHVILWQLKDELSDTEKAAVKAGIKEGLEGLAGRGGQSRLYHRRQRADSGRRRAGRPGR